jgi:hypothetical protein
VVVVVVHDHVTSPIVTRQKNLTSNRWGMRGEGRGGERRLLGSGARKQFIPTSPLFAAAALIGTRRVPSNVTSSEEKEGAC